MKKLTFIALCAVSLLGLNGCDDYLDIKPKGYTIPETYQDYAALIENNSLFFVNCTKNTNLLTDDIQLGGQTDQPSSSTLVSAPIFEQNLYKFANGQVHPMGEGDGSWTFHYSNIFTYNVVINNVLSSKGGNTAEKQRVQAEALFGRAMEYFTLINTYAKHYSKSTASSDYGVPILLTEDINQKVKRHSVAQVYEQIEKDLNEAIKYLPETPRKAYFPGKMAAHCFKARLHLYKGEYELALNEAKEVLKKHNTLVDYKNYTIIPGATWGRCVLLSNPNITFPELEKNEENILIRLDQNNFDIEGFISNELVDLFSKDKPTTAIDQRFTFFYAKDFIKMGKKSFKFPGKVIRCSYLNMNPTGFKTSEMYLIAAECEARIGSATEAMKYLNKVRDSRIKNNIHLVAADGEQALRLVLEERRREFATLGNIRLVDLKRLNMDDRFKKDVVHTVDSETWTLPANDNRYIFPIPNTVLDFNPDMPQYER